MNGEFKGASAKTTALGGNPRFRPSLPQRWLVGEMLPDAMFEAYLRVFHPFRRPLSSCLHLESWRNAAREAGLDWCCTLDINVLAPVVQARGWEAPEPGALPPTQLVSIAQRLMRNEPARWAWWPGVGPLPHDLPASNETIEVHGERFQVFTLAVADLESLLTRPHDALLDPPSPSLGWSDTGEWALHTGLDHRSTYLAARRALLEPIRALPDLETCWVRPDDPDGG